MKIWRVPHRPGGPRCRSSAQRGRAQPRSYTLRHSCTTHVRMWGRTAISGRVETRAVLSGPASFSPIFACCRCGIGLPVAPYSRWSREMLVIERLNESSCRSVMQRRPSTAGEGGNTASPRLWAQTPSSTAMVCSASCLLTDGSAPRRLPAPATTYDSRRTCDTQHVRPPCIATLRANCCSSRGAHTMSSSQSPRTFGDTLLPMRRAVHLGSCAHTSLASAHSAGSSHAAKVYRVSTKLNVRHAPPPHSSVSVHYGHRNSTLPGAHLRPQDKSEGVALPLAVRLRNSDGC